MINLHELFKNDESPYFAMFRAGLHGHTIEECLQECIYKNIPVREKDINSWKEGHWKKAIKTNLRSGDVLNPVLVKKSQSGKMANLKLEDFPKWPSDWLGTDRRWFPCTGDNRPMQKWGYSEFYTPTLLDRPSAQAISQCGWVGQNVYAQTFIVFDIDGVGHGSRDDQVIAFGNKFREGTQCWEDPMKPGSFHLYFSTNRRIPIAHYNYAKLDVLGNHTNAAVYTKNKQSNGLQMAPLTQEIWDEMQAYVKGREQQRKQELANLTERV